MGLKIVEPNNALFKRLLRCPKTSGAHLRSSKLRSGFLGRLASILKITLLGSTTNINFGRASPAIKIQL
jgi:hypothetical protein